MKETVEILGTYHLERRLREFNAYNAYQRHEKQRKVSKSYFNKSAQMDGEGKNSVHKCD